MDDRASVASIEDQERRVIGRYVLFGEIASGGMATVHFGRLVGPIGFTRTVAIKCLHAHFARDSELSSMFVDEARLAARIRHPNVVPTSDVVSHEDHLYIVMDYVEGESLGALMRQLQERRESVPPRIAAAILVGALHGLHAAHDATSERGEPLEIVHRDVSPQNILVGVDGVPRVLDFGVAKAAWRLQTTQDGQIKGKFAYMAPEQVRQEPVDRRLDIYAAGIVLWEALTGQRLFKSQDPTVILEQVMNADVPPPSRVVRAPETPIHAALDRVVLKAISRSASDRYATAREMATAIEEAVPLASQTEVGAWVRANAGDVLVVRARRVAAIERISMVDIEDVVARPPASSPPPRDLSLTDATTVVVPRSAEPPRLPSPAPPKRRVPVALGVAVTLGMALAIVVGRQAAPASHAIATESTSTPQASASEPPPTIEIVDQAPAAIAPPISTLASTAAPPPPSRKPRRAPPAASPSRNCDPPFYVDARGIRRPKMECL